MTNLYVGKSATWVIPEDLKYLTYTQMFSDIYDNFNKEVFDNIIEIPTGFKPVIDMVYDFHNQKYNNITEYTFPTITLNNNNKDVLISLSGGLDSIGQALDLYEQGYIIHLFHVKGLNTYENNQSTKICREFANIMKFDYIEVDCKKVAKKTDPYKQFWPENPVKNQMVFSIMVDYCYGKGYKLISAGDALTLGIETRTVGVNLTDCNELTIKFWNGIKTYVNNLEFIPTYTTKFEKLLKLKQYDLLDLYYPCLNAGRFNQSLHKQFEQKFNVKIPKYLCGYCRKCVNSILMLHYGNIITYPDEVINFCWSKMCPNNKNQNTASYEYGQHIPLEQRIKSLFEDKE